MRVSPRRSEEAVSKLLLTLYETALAPSQWQVFLQQFIELLQSRAITIQDHDCARRSYEFNTSIGMDASALSDYEQHFGKLDPYWAEFSKTPHNAFALGEQLCPRRHLLKTEFYGDFLAKHPEPLGVYTAAVSMKQPTHWQAISTYQALRDEPPGDETVDLIRLVVPHIRNCLQLQQRLVDLNSEIASLDCALDSLGFAVLLLDEAGRTVFVSQKAEALLVPGNGLILRQGELSTPIPVQAKALAALIARTLATATHGAARVAAPIFVSRRCGGALRISAIALPRSAPPSCLAIGRRAVAILFIRDTEADTQSLAGLLKTVYGLTPAETRLGLMLFEGQSLVEAARTNGVSIETVRVQLKSIFQKTGTHRQAGLIQLLNELCKAQ